jgi:hypothetical protein
MAHLLGRKNKATASGGGTFTLLLGKAALRGARMKLENLQKDFDANAEITEAADFPETEAAQAK